jgi:rfaE bifunctional protein nucleotidyltransferase chain/domain
VKKIITPNELPTIINQSRNKTIVLVGGCFDILHPGHIAFLTAAKKIGDILILLLESDQAVTKRKGKGRPINNAAIRSQNLLKQTPVDIIIKLSFPFKDADYDSLVSAIKPAIIATTKGDPFLSHKIRQAEKNDAQVVEVIERLGDHSTTNSIKTL